MSINNKNYKQQLAKQLSENQQTIYIFETEQLLKEAEYQKIDVRGHHMFGMDNTSLTTTALDAHTATALLREFGLQGEAYIKSGQHGKQYIIFKGYPGERKLIVGTRYLASNPQVVNMAIGQLGVHKSVIQGASIAIVMYVGINLLEYLLNDEGTKARVFGTLASDMTKVAISSVMGALFGAGTATITGAIAAPIAVAVVITLAIGWVLNVMDEHYQLTEKLIKAIEQTSDNVEYGILNFFNELESEIEWRIDNNIPF